MIKKLKIILVVLLVLIFLLIWVAGKKLSSYEIHDEPPIVENLSEVYNQGGRFLKYGDYVYFVNSKYNGNKFTNKLYSRNINTKEERAILDFFNILVDSDLWIYGNRVFFYEDGKTRWWDVSTYREYSFYSGKLSFIEDGVTYFSYKDQLYYARYYPETFQLNSTVPSVIVKGSCTYLGRDDERVYYYTVDDFGNIRFISIDHQGRDGKSLDAIYASNYQYHLKDFVFTDQYLYYLLEEKSGSLVLKRCKLDPDDQTDMMEIKDLKIMKLYSYKDDVYFVTEDSKIYKYSARGTLSEASVPSDQFEFYYIMQDAERDRRRCDT